MHPQWSKSVRLPHLDQAQVDVTKLTEYVLNPNHPEGRHKARVFLSALGITAANGGWLADAILLSIRNADAVLQADTRWGALYRVDVDIVRGQRCAKVRTAWLCHREAARLTTCFASGTCRVTIMVTHTPDHEIRHSGLDPESSAPPSGCRPAPA
jgi:hypothetical protein